MATRMIWMTDLLVNQRVNPGQIVKIILCLLPQAILFSMPAVCLMSVLLAFIRLSADNEIVALNASGISLFQTMAPVVFFSLISYLIAGFIAIYWVPWGNKSYRDVVLKLVKSRTDVAIKERVFYEPFDNVVFYVNSFSSKERIMKDIFVVDRRDQPITITIVAKRGKIATSNGSDTVTIHFMDGTIFTNEMDMNKSRTIKFDTYDYNIDLRDVISSMISREKEPKEMYINELIQNFQKLQGKSIKKNLIGIKLFEMFSIPLATFILGLIAAPLGAHLKGRAYSKGILVSLLIFLAYYVSLMGVRYICETGIIAPSVGVWIPVFFLFLICVYLHIQTTNYRLFRF
jgi:lipopolysaccharide export system permease protein